MIIIMNKLRLLALASVVTLGTIFIQSCGGGDDPAPTPEVNFIGDAGFTAQDASINGATAFKIGVVATHSVKLSKLEIFVAYDGGPNLKPADCTVCDSSIDGTNLRAIYSGVTRSIAGSEKWTFRVTDKDGESTSKSITITTTPAGGANLIEIAKDNDNNTLKVWNFKGPKPGAYDLLNGGNLLSSDPGADKDIQDSTRDEEVASWPARWTSRNGTTFKLVTAYTYSQITTTTTLESAWTSSGAPKSALTGLKTGDLIVANLRGAAGSYALVQVTNVVKTGSDNNDYVEFKYKKKS
jgi:hypothetical protein